MNLTTALAPVLGVEVATCRPKDVLMVLLDSESETRSQFEVCLKELVLDGKRDCREFHQVKFCSAVQHHQSLLVAFLNRSRYLSDLSSISQ